MVKQVSNGNGKALKLAIVVITILGSIVVVAGKMTYDSFAGQQQVAAQDRARMALTQDQIRAKNEKQDSCLVALKYDIVETKKDAAITRNYSREILRQLEVPEAKIMRLEIEAIDSVNRDTVRDTTR